MGKATIPLAQNKFIPEKLSYPAYLSIKYDGVPVKITVVGNGHGVQVNAVTRQDEPVPSIANYLEVIRHDMAKNQVICNVTFAAEITHVSLTNFKDISGLVRKQSPQNGFIFNIFEFVNNDSPDEPFSNRLGELEWFTENLPAQFRMVQQNTYFSKDHLRVAVAMLQKTLPEEEGFIARSGTDTWQPNKRHWGYQKIVVDPTADLFIVGFKEAIEKSTGLGKGMVGRLIAEYKGSTIGVGPGKLSHKEREDLWAEWTQWQAAIESGWKETKWRQIATVQYKRDDSYEALRQATFQHWRPEKTEPSY